MAFENFHAHLKDLKPRVKEKALEIANDLLEKQGLSEEKAIKKAIKMAEEWFYDLEG